MPQERPIKLAPIRQEDIRILLGLEQLIRQRWEIYDQEAKSVLRRILAGTEVEEGPHSAAVRRTIAAAGALSASAWIAGRLCHRCPLC